MNLKSLYAQNGFLKLAALTLAVSGAVLAGCSSGTSTPAATDQTAAKAATPIQHVVVIFQENVSFDHYFGTYPKAANPVGEPGFTAASGTPVANTLVTPLDVTKNFAPLTGIDLMTKNPTAVNAANGTNGINPFRIDRSQANPNSQNHDYDAEQKGFNNGAMDLFPASTGTANTAAPQTLQAPFNTPGIVMGYFDGNTVTAFWNYAQHYAMSDNSYGTNFGPSNVGALNLIAGQINGVIATNAAAASGGTNIDYELSNDGNGGISQTSDPQPLGDACSTRDAVTMGGKNVGDMLNAANVSWGFFMGGFDLTVTNTNGTTGCKRTTVSAVTSVNKVDYIPHHQPFQYYKSTQNLTHARPSSVTAIGNTYEADGKTVDPANHQYDIHDFFDAVSAGNYPAVSFLKAPGYQDGHAGYSDPLDEQAFVTQVINFLQQQPGWSSTMVIIAYDDSDGWYDHQMSPIVNPSKLVEGAAGAAGATANMVSNGVTVLGQGDFLNGPGVCNTGLQQGTATPTTALAGYDGKANAQGRCGYGPRLPLLVISPYAKVNYIDHTLTDQASILRFIEDNWLGSQRITGSFDAIAGPLNNMLNLSGTPSTATLFLDPSTGQPAPCANCKAQVRQ
ncbi:MAG TPA: alkaline phosphatase family protein [Burkholderiaceae bacterium]